MCEIRCGFSTPPYPRCSFLLYSMPSYIIHKNSCSVLLKEVRTAYLFWSMSEPHTIQPGTPMVNGYPVYNTSHHEGTGLGSTPVQAGVPVQPQPVRDNWKTELFACSEDGVSETRATIHSTLPNIWIPSKSYHFPIYSLLILGNLLVGRLVLLCSFSPHFTKLRRRQTYQ